MGGAVGVDQGDQLGVQRQVAVLAQLADRDMQPRPGADEHDRIGLQAGEFADPQPGAQQHLDGDADEHPRVGLGGAQEFRGGGVVEGLGQGVVLAGQVAGEHRHPGRGLVPAPFVDADEEHPQGAEPVRDRRGGQPGLVLPGPGGQPGLEVLDVAAGDLRPARWPGSCLGQERGERTQRQVRAADAAGPQHAGDLLQVTAHRDGDCGITSASCSQSGSSAGPVTGRSAGRSREDLGVDRLGGPPVLRGQPVITQVQVDAGRLDRGVPGLGLDRLQRHPGFAQLGQAGMPQLMAGRPGQPGPAAGTVEDLVQPVR